jgi:hypothetical protein
VLASSEKLATPELLVVATYDSAPAVRRTVAPTIGVVPLVVTVTVRA